MTNTEHPQELVKYKQKSTVLIEILLNYRYNCISIEKYDGAACCYICMLTMKNKYVIKLPCHHVFHRNCILKNIYTYQRKKCPLIHCEKILEWKW